MLPFHISLFNKLVHHFVSASDALKDDWFVEKHYNAHCAEELILRKKVTICKENNVSGESSGEEDLEDDGVFSDECGTDILTWDYQIIFSESFCAPILYFNVSDSSGRPVSLDGLQVETKSNFGVISQQMHPIFNFPFYYVHPCDMASNSSWFKLAKESGTNALVTWLSTVASIVNLTIPEQYSRYKFDY
ncbi:ubiquitin-like-conjugating enzyme ATG10 [Nilaparvata lugens]|uniref:ubiquitin-like-conjugating enzyme ATG10 n=1 Tax=Nilaparvata lugens TaxID=108931 RepID=UPI00193D0F9F|nr:ubiquitin-like-conjugating enzyme ATG10 [Nilaparvata lugens]